jgi:8-oxo-dGTP pyrophosphatase MutT (NUDIX family)/enamine deaminase RidA (YjgF/YER057c/UK114 family)
MGITVPAVVMPVGAYVPALREGDLVFTSGQLPMVDGAMAATGQVGEGEGLVSPAQAKELAAASALNAIAAVKSVIGDLDLVTRVVKVVGFVAVRPGLHRPAGRRQRGQRAARRRLRRCGCACPIRRGCGSAAARGIGRGRDRRLGRAARLTRRPAVPSVIRDFPTRHTPALDAHAREWEAAGRPAAPPARPAATVMLVRDRRDSQGVAPGVEVFMLLRVATMAFAPNTMVFPGGGVDRRDGVELPWAGPPVHAWAARLDSDEQLTREILVAAVREVFEECGVLFASRPRTGGWSTPAANAGRPCVSGWLPGRRPWARCCATTELLLRTDLLRAHAHWMTPEIEPRQFDARIFAALMPEGATADGETSEASIPAGSARGGPRRA